jgi:hypothetical protein
MPTTQKKMNQKKNVCVLPITRKLLGSQRRKMSQIRKMAISQYKKKKKKHLASLISTKRGPEHSQYFEN